MRSTRQVIPSHPHHVVLQGVAASKLFSYPSDYLRFLRYLVESTARNACQLHGFALLSDRANLLLTPRTPMDLSNCVQVACQRYAVVRNRLTKRQGSVFLPRYLAQAHPPGELWQVRATIEFQPVAAGKALQPAAYRWSSANLALAKSLGLTQFI